MCTILKNQTGCSFMKRSVQSITWKGSSRKQHIMMCQVGCQTLRTVLGTRSFSVASPKIWNSVFLQLPQYFPVGFIYKNKCTFRPTGMTCLSGKVTVGLVESNGSLPPGLWLMSPTRRLPRNRDSSVPNTCNWVRDYFLCHSVSDDDL